MTRRHMTEYEKIRLWIEDHGGFPARIRGVPDEEAGEDVEISFDPQDPEMERIGWDEFFAWLERNNLALAYDSGAREREGHFEFVDKDEIGNELGEETGLPDSGEPEVFRANIVPDSD